MVIRWRGKSVTKRIRAATMRGVIRGTELTLQIAVNKIKNPPKTGKIYIVANRAHQASAPGEAPANMYGGLIQSGHTEYDTKALSGKVVFSSRYADFLELGTIKMAPRPYLRPSLAEALAPTQKFIQEEIEAERGRIDKELGITPLTTAAPASQGDQDIAARTSVERGSSRPSSQLRFKPRSSK